MLLFVLTHSSFYWSFIVRQVLLADFPQKLEIPSGTNQGAEEQRERRVAAGYALEYLHNLSMEHTLVEEEEELLGRRPTTAPN